MKRKAKTQDQTGLVLYFYILELCGAKATFFSSIVLGVNFISFGEPGDFWVKNRNHMISGKFLMTLISHKIFFCQRALLQNLLGFKHLQNNYSEHNVGQSIICIVVSSPELA